MGTFPYSEAVVRWRLVGVMLPGDRPGIVTDFVTSTSSAGSATQPFSVKSAQRRTTSLVEGLEPSPRRKRYLLSGPGADERSQSSQRVTKPLMNCRASGRVIVFTGASPL
jgi:hypothetical protein